MKSKNVLKQLKWDISKYEVIDEPVENNTAPIAAKLASKGKIKIIVKGHIHTDVLMKETLRREHNLLGKKRLSHIWHMTVDKIRLSSYNHRWCFKCFAKYQNKNAYLKKCS